MTHIMVLTGVSRSARRFTFGYACTFLFFFLVHCGMDVLRCCIVDLDVGSVGRLSMKFQKPRLLEYGG